MNTFFSRERGDLGPPPRPFWLDPSMPRRGGSPLSRWVILGVLLFFLLVGGGIARSIYVDLLWYDSLGFSSIYVTGLTTRLWLFVAGFVGFFALSWINLLVAQRLAPPPRVFAPLAPELAVLRRFTSLILLLGTLFLSLIFGSIAMGEWSSVLRLFNASAFPTTDPIFGQNIGFYVFTLPIYRFLQFWLIGALALAFLTTLGVYILNYSVQQFTLSLNQFSKAHLSVLAALLALLFAVGYWLDAFDLLYSERGAAFGASYADVVASLPALRILLIVAVLFAVLLLMNIPRRGWGLPGLGLGIWIAAIVLVGTIYPAFVQRFQVEPNEFEKERQYIAADIRMTREAFGLDRVFEQPFSAQKELSYQDVLANQDTITNVRLWDHRPLLSVFNQRQAIRLYYDFNDVDIDRYTVDGKYRQVMLGPRELFPERLATQAQTWVNLRLQFTHGYGTVVSPVNEVDPDGLPILWEKDVPPTGKFTIERPEIYYGERTTDYVIVGTKTPEFDYATTEDQPVYSTYEGTSGVILDSALKRFIFSWEFGDANLVLSEQLTNGSRILFHRQIQERVRRIAPFLMLDRDPYLVIADGKLFWVQDAYTATDNYPYSVRHSSGFNYIRNSVKVVTDAYDGSLTFYIADPDDPLIKTYQAVYPALFAPLSEMPQSIRSHLRYPEDLFMVQAQMYRTYHMTDPQVFYNREDLYNMPMEIYGDAQQPMQAYYLIMRLPGQQNPEFLLLLPFTPTGQRNNMIAWLAARSDGENYGKLIAYRFPKDRFINGPMNIEALISNDPNISSQFTLWNQAGSQVIRGNLLVIPIADSILYVEPVFLQAEQAPVPELKRVVVAMGDRIAMEATFADALNSVFGRKGAPPEVSPGAPAPGAPAGAPVPAELSGLVKEAQEHYNRAQQYLRAGDFARYGDEIKALETTLNRMAELTGQK